MVMLIFTSLYVQVTLLYRINTQTFLVACYNKINNEQYEDDIPYEIKAKSLKKDIMKAH